MEINKLPETEIDQNIRPNYSNSLECFINPKSIVFIGASGTIGKWGHMLFVNTVSGNFKGKIYLVNHKGGTIAGRQVYKSVSAIPESVDLAVVTIPASKVIDLIPQFKDKGISNMLLITSGFGEIGREGKDNEKKLVREAEKAKILILGPNTMGICNPHADLFCVGVPVKPIPGSTTIVSQSGNLGTQLLRFSAQQGIGIRGFWGSGNEAVITFEDFIEAFEKDPLTRTLMLYVESVKNGRRFFEVARRTGKKKPIVLLHGGRSKAGSLAAASHTGAMASDSNVFNTACKQAGIVTVKQSIELLDLAAAFSSLPLPEGNRVAIMTLGGGWGVITTDLCSDYGIKVEQLSSDLLKRLDKKLPFYWSRSNPVDMVGETDTSLPMAITEELLKWEGCDAVISMGTLGRKFTARDLSDSILKVDPNYSPEFLESTVQALSDFDENYINHIIYLMEKYKKPVFCVSFIAKGKDQIVYKAGNSRYNGILYPTPERAVKTFAKMYEYRRFINH